MDAKSVKTCLLGLAAGGGLALLTQMGIVTPPSILTSGGGLGLPLAEAGPVDFSMYEVPSFMAAIYEGKFGETGFTNPQYRTGYAIAMADSIRQSCRGPFTTAQINQWETKVMRHALSQVTPENGWKILEQQLKTWTEVYKNPEVLAEMNNGMPAPEELPMKAQQDTMTFVQEHTCNGPVFEKFTTNLGEAAGMDIPDLDDQKKM